MYIFLVAMIGDGVLDGVVVVLSSNLKRGYARFHLHVLAYSIYDISITTFSFVIFFV